MTAAENQNAEAYETVADDFGHTGVAPAGKATAGSSSSNNPLKAGLDDIPRPQGRIVNIQPVRREDMQPSFAQVLSTETEVKTFYGTAYHAIGNFVGFFGQIPGCFCCPAPFKEVPTGAVGLVTKYGRAVRAVDPGLAYVNPCSESLRVANVQLQVTALPSQQVLTRDNVKVNVDAVLTWQISSPYRAMFGVTDVKLALIERAQTTLRQVMGARNLQTLIADRESVAAEIQESVEEISEKWGVHVESITLKDILLDEQTQNLLSSAATQRRLGESKIIAAKAEVESAKLMRAAADILSSPAAMQIRQLETWQTMAKQAGTKVIFVPQTIASMGPVDSRTLAATSSNPVAAANAATSGPIGDVATLNQLATI